MFQQQLLFHICTDTFNIKQLVHFIFVCKLIIERNKKCCNIFNSYKKEFFLFHNMLRRPRGFCHYCELKVNCPNALTTSLR